jgi:hypothetical protein
VAKSAISFPSRGITDKKQLLVHFPIGAHRSKYPRRISPGGQTAHHSAIGVWNRRLRRRVRFFPQRYPPDYSVLRPNEEFIDFTGARGKRARLSPSRTLAATGCPLTVEGEIRRPCVTACETHVAKKTRLLFFN